jgi:hypothetical protein
MLGVFLIALLILAAAAAAAARRRQRRGAAGEVVRQPEDVERDVYEKLYGSHSSEGRISDESPKWSVRVWNERLCGDCARTAPHYLLGAGCGERTARLCRSRATSPAGR